MSLVLDLIVVLIIASSAVSNAKRGFVRSVLIVLAGALSLVLAWGISSASAPVIYDKLARDMILEKVQGKLVDLDSAEIVSEKFFKEQYGVEVSTEQVRELLLSGGDTEKKLAELAEKNLGEKVSGSQVSEFFEKEGIQGVNIDIPENIFKDETDGFYKILAAFAEKNEAEKAEKIETAFIRPVAVAVIRTLTAAVLFAVIFAILKNIASAAEFVEKLPIAGTLNSVLGAVVGIIEGMILVIAIGLVIKMIVTLGFGGDVLNGSVIRDSFIFRIFYF